MKKIRLVNSFMVVEAKKPIKDPKADFRALFRSFGSWINSPIKAPTKAPITNPKGMGTMSPMIRPSVAPVAPFLEPPNLLAPIPGIK